MIENKIIKNIIEKSQMKIAVSKFQMEDIKMIKKTNLNKLIAMFTLTIGMTAGLVYAGNIAYEKIWKEPEAYKISDELTQEEKDACISEEEAEKIGNSYLKKIGFNEQTIQSLGLRKDWFSQENIWDMSSEKVTLRIDGKTGDIKSVNIPTWEYSIPYNYGISREQAREVAKELLERYKPENDNSEYELISLKRNNEQDEEAYIWYADFYKKYNDLINPVERISIGWIPTINALYSLNIEKNVYENNEQKVSQEEAIKIAIDKDKEIETKKNIKTTRAQIRIKQMNENVYLRENFKEEYEKGTINMEKTGENTYKYKDNAVFYKTIERVRNVWCVVIQYDMDDKYVGSAFTYYIDSTTGEIIGGQRGDDFYSENMLKNDPNNVIKK